MMASTTGDLLDGVDALAWPAVVLFVVLLFRRQIRERIGSLREAELPGGIRFRLGELEREVTVSTRATAGSGAAYAHGEVVADNLYAVAGVRLEVERALRRLAVVGVSRPRYEYIGDVIDTPPERLIAELRADGELNRRIAQHLTEFLRLTDAALGVDSDITEEAIGRLVTVGALLAADLRYRERVVAITGSVEGHMLMHPLMEFERRGGGDQEGRLDLAIVATMLPDVEYNYELFLSVLDRAIRSTDGRNWPPSMSPMFARLRISREDFLEVVRFRAAELRRLLAVSNNEWYAADWGEGGRRAEEWRLYQWPREWGEIEFNQPVTRTRPKPEVADELLTAEAAITRISNQLDG